MRAARENKRNACRHGCPQEQHQVAWVYPDTGEIQEFTPGSTAREIERMVKKVREQAPGEVHVCCEAGVGGFPVGSARLIQAYQTEASTKPPASKAALREQA